jgi:hypothetical protein
MPNRSRTRGERRAGRCARRDNRRRLPSKRHLAGPRCSAPPRRPMPPRTTCAIRRERAGRPGRINAAPRRGRRVLLPVQRLYAVRGRRPRFRCVRTVPENGVHISRRELSGRVTEMAPKPPNARRAPARPGRSSSTGVGGEVAPCRRRRRTTSSRPGAPRRGRVAPSQPVRWEGGPMAAPASDHVLASGRAPGAAGSLLVNGRDGEVAPWRRRRRRTRA